MCTITLFQFDIRKDEADAIAKKELEAVFAASAASIDLADPAAALRNTLMQKPGWTPDFVNETKKFYEGAQWGVVKNVPMRTYLKHQYGTGVNVDLLKEHELPEHRDILTLNTPRFLRKRFKNMILFS